MKNPNHPEHEKSRKRRGRFLAVLLGLSLSVVLIGGSTYWLSSYVEGTEACKQCGFRRDVDRRGPFWSRSEPYASRMTPDPSATYSGHLWVKVGCWREDGMYAYYFWKVVDR